MYRSFLVSILMLFSFTLTAKEPDSLRTYKRADLSFIFGGQIHNDNFLYNPGFSFQAVYGIMVNELLGIGAGAGHQVFRNEKFIPLFLEVSGYRKPGKNSSFLKTQAGYSVGWYTGTTGMEGYDYRGGLFFDAGFGRKFPLGRKSDVLFHCSYRHQCARVDYSSPSLQEYDQKLHYDMIVFHLGFNFRNK